jgi:hypothetical protein
VLGISVLTIVIYAKEVTMNRKALATITFLTTMLLFTFNLAAPAYANECQQIHSSFDALRSSDKAKRESAKSQIVTFSESSKSARECVIGKLLEAATIQNGRSDFIRYPERFFEWSEVVDLLATLRVTEGLGVLVRCLDCNDGRAGLSLGRLPAAKAMARFGELAVPKLDEALSLKDPMIRYRAAETLHAIGGAKAKQVLQRALAKEQVKWIANQMRNMLQAWHGLREG